MAKTTDELVKKIAPKTKTPKKKVSKMKNQNLRTIVTVVATLAVVGAVTLVALTAYNKGVNTGAANERKLQSTIQEAVAKQSKQ